MTPRDEIACMMRIRNEDRWIRKSMEATWQVAKTIVILDDGSDDDTHEEAALALGEATNEEENIHVSLDGSKVLHYINSPFRPAVRETQAVSEIRDKNFLWEYCKSKVLFTHMLCLDGDEVLGKYFIEDFEQIVIAMDQQVDIFTFPFLYLWDSDEQIRVDGIYGNLPDGYPRLRFPRAFTIKRVTPDQLHVMRFSWEGSKGGFHCGSIPRENFRTTSNNGNIVGAFYNNPIIHYGYRDEKDRQRKYVFYNKIDPGNVFEGEYKHIIGQANVHAPGPVELKPFNEAMA